MGSSVFALVDAADQTSKLNKNSYVYYTVDLSCRGPEFVEHFHGSGNPNRNLQPMSLKHPCNSDSFLR